MIGRPVVDDTKEDMAFFGIEDADYQPETDTVIFEVFEENKDAVNLFVLCDTQWTVGLSGRTGLNYSVLLSLMELYSIKDRREVFEDVRTMEIAAINALAKEPA